MVDTTYVGSASQGYRNNTVAGLAEPDMLEKGLHGIVVYLNRAKILASQEQGEAHGYQKAQALADADQLLTFLLRLADTDTEMGSTLANCYTGVQQLISSALISEGDESMRALDDALDQARALEKAFKESIGGGENGQAH